MQKITKNYRKLPKAAKSCRKVPKVANSCQQLPKDAKSYQKLPKVNLVTDGRMYVCTYVRTGGLLELLSQLKIDFDLYSSVLGDKIFDI